MPDIQFTINGFLEANVGVITELVGIMKKGSKEEKLAAAKELGMLFIKGHVSKALNYWPAKALAVCKGDDSVAALIERNQPILQQTDPKMLLLFTRCCVYNIGNWTHLHAETWSNNDTSEFIRYFSKSDPPSSDPALMENHKLLKDSIQALAASSESAYPWLWAELPDDSKSIILDWIRDIADVTATLKTRVGEHTRLASNIYAIERLKVYLTTQPLTGV